MLPPAQELEHPWRNDAAAADDDNCVWTEGRELGLKSLRSFLIFSGWMTVSPSFSADTTVAAGAQSVPVPRPWGQSGLEVKASCRSKRAAAKMTAPTSAPRTAACRMKTVAIPTRPARTSFLILRLIRFSALQCAYVADKQAAIQVVDFALHKRREPSRSSCVFSNQFHFHILRAHGTPRWRGSRSHEDPAGSSSLPVRSACLHGQPISGLISTSLAWGLSLKGHRSRQCVWKCRSAPYHNRPTPWRRVHGLQRRSRRPANTDRH